MSISSDGCPQSQQLPVLLVSGSGALLCGAEDDRSDLPEQEPAGAASPHQVNPAPAIDAELFVSVF